MTSTRRTLGRFTFALVVAALLGTALTGLGTPHADAAPIEQDASKVEMQELCDLGGGRWVDDGDGTDECMFKTWDITCDGATCEITCSFDTLCLDPQGRIGLPELRDQAIGAEDQVVAPVSTPAPTRGTGRTTAPVMVAADSRTTLIVVATDERP